MSTCSAMCTPDAPRIGDVVRFRPRESDVACVGVLVEIEDFAWLSQRVFKIWVESSCWARLEIVDARVALTIERRPSKPEVTGILACVFSRYDRFLGNARDVWGAR